MSPMDVSIGKKGTFDFFTITEGVKALFHNLSRVIIIPGPPPPPSTAHRTSHEKILV